MLREIWKFAITNNCTIEMPKGAQVVSANIQSGKVCIWALVDATAIKEKRKFIILATGQNIPESKNTYIKTIFSENAEFVFHVFEIHENENREI